MYKKGNTTNCQNYRAIWLSFVAFKLHTRILEKEIKKKNEKNYTTGKQPSDKVEGHSIAYGTQRYNAAFTRALEKNYIKPFYI